ncbi:hypothetical protein ACS3SW_10220 [Roseobacteraceae bacterium S113]
MKRIALAIILAAQPCLAEEPEGLSLMERGAQLFFEGLMQEIDPALRELEDLAQNMEPALRSFAEEMGPALQGLLAEIEDWSAYHPPEVLENGDIILRKKTPAERAAEGDTTDDIEI